MNGLEVDGTGLDGVYSVCQGDLFHQKDTSGEGGMRWIHDPKRLGGGTIMHMVSIILLKFKSNNEFRFGLNCWGIALSLEGGFELKLNPRKPPEATDSHCI